MAGRASDDEDVAMAVAVGLRTAARSPVTGIEETSVRALAKLEQVLPSRLRRRVSALADYIVPVPPDSPVPAVDPAVLTTLASACRDPLHAPRAARGRRRRGLRGTRGVLGGLPVPQPRRDPAAPLLPAGPSRRDRSDPLPSSGT